MLTQTTDILKELEYAGNAVLPLLFDYRVQCAEENNEVAIDIEREYRSGMMDPSRTVALQERLAAVRKNVGRKRKIMDHIKRVVEELDNPRKGAS